MLKAGMCPVRRGQQTDRLHTGQLRRDITSEGVCGLEQRPDGGHPIDAGPGAQPGGEQLHVAVIETVGTSVRAAVGAAVGLTRCF